MKSWDSLAGLCLVMITGLASTTQASVVCPAEWSASDSRCYYAWANTMDWDHAVAYCNVKQPGAWLAEVESQEEADFIIPLLVYETPRAWLGGKKGTNISPTVWNSNNQDVSTVYTPATHNTNGNIDGCLIMMDDGSWDILDCSASVGILCEWDPAPTNPTTEVFAASPTSVLTEAPTLNPTLPGTASIAAAAISTTESTSQLVSTGTRATPTKYNGTCSENKSNFCISAIRTTPEIGLGSMIHVTTVASVSSCMSLCCPGECQAFSYNSNGTCVIYDDVNPAEPQLNGDWSFYAMNQL